MIGLTFKSDSCLIKGVSIINNTFALKGNLNDILA